MPKLPLVCVALAAAMTIPSIAQARGKSTVAEERLIAGCIHRSARGKLWLEKALSALRDQEGGWIGAQVPNRDGSHDLGPMQINSWWVQPFAKLLGQSPVRVRRWLLKDVCFNVEAARWLLLTELVHSPDIWAAIGRYHSPTLWRQHRYIVAIAGRLSSLDKMHREKH